VRNETEKHTTPEQHFADISNVLLYPLPVEYLDSFSFQIQNSTVLGTLRRLIFAIRNPQFGWSVNFVELLYFEHLQKVMGLQANISFVDFQRKNGGHKILWSAFLLIFEDISIYLKVR
jgi:hypothetical protein